MEPPTMRSGQLTRALLALLALATLATSGCKREERRFREIPPAADATTNVVMSTLQPGPSIVSVASEHPYDRNAYAISQGQRLYVQMNCAGCHGLAGGGSIGPPLMDEKWVYGSDPANIFSTIIEGRPNGMPSWRGKLSNDQVWQLVAYIRDMAGLHRKDVRASRSDDMAAVPDNQNRNRQTPRPTSNAPASTNP
jgi:cytochrome c oxidase cbb3-type subunit 3